MGKISDALERRRKEKPQEKVNSSVGMPDDTVSLASPIGLSGECSLPAEYSDKLVVFSAPDSPDCENFKVLRAQLLFPSNRERPRTIMVTSSFPGEGKTFVAANLAASISLGIDEYVLLVDCDLRRPHVHEMFGCHEPEGLHEYLTGKKDLSQLIVRTKIQKLSMLPAGRAPLNPTELLSSARMETFLEEVKNRYQDRFIVIDSTPSQVTAEANILAKHVDGVVLVVMARKSPRKVVQKTVDNLGRDKILGVVFNGYSKAHKGYHKYYKRYYKMK